jgi:hypothetical protein
MPASPSKQFRAYAKGTRLPVPAELKSPHFFYKATPASFAPEDLALVASQVVARIHELGVDALQIEVLSLHGENGLDSQGFAALERIQAAFSFGDLDNRDVSFVYCNWASPHADALFEGSVFASLVLHTGGSPYHMTTVHTERRSRKGLADLELLRTSRVLEVGDFFMPDPTTPHVAAPARSRDDSLLVLLQWDIPVADTAAQAQLLASFPPSLSNTGPDLSAL